jgi:CheY-like chemotaxis protein
MEAQRVLVVERDWRMRKLIRANLEVAGLEVQEAVGGHHGLQLLVESQPDLILLDVDRLDVDVLHVIGVLRRQRGKRPASIITMSADPPGRLLTEHGYVAGHLSKPFAAPVLLQKVQGALDRTLPDEEEPP